MNEIVPKTRVSDCKNYEPTSLQIDGRGLVMYIMKTPHGVYVSRKWMGSHHYRFAARQLARAVASNSISRGIASNSKRKLRNALIELKRYFDAMAFAGLANVFVTAYWLLLQSQIGVDCTDHPATVESSKPEDLPPYPPPLKRMPQIQPNAPTYL